MADDRIPDNDALDARIAAAKAVGVRSADGGRPAKGYAQGSRVLAEMIGAPLGAALFGWLFDRWFGTSPWLLLVLLVLGVVVAGRNIMRISKENAK